MTMKKHSLDNSDKVNKAFASTDIDKLISEDEGILTGGGGGWSQFFTDFVVNISGETFLNYYSIAIDSGDMDVFQSAKLLLGERSKEYERLMKMAIEIDFFKIKIDHPPGNTIVRHTAAAHSTYGKNRVIWAMDASNPPPEELVKFDQEIRNFLTKSFKEEFG
jgi:hypothetical protein